MPYVTNVWATASAGSVGSRGKILYTHVTRISIAFATGGVDERDECCMLQGFRQLTLGGQQVPIRLGGGRGGGWGSCW